MSKKYDYLIVGSGLFGAVFAHFATLANKKCLVIDRRSHTGGNIYCENRDGINIHKYGAHIFHTSNRDVWEFVQKFAEFNNYVNSPIANFRGEIYNLPFNMNTFAKMWGVATPEQAREIIAAQQGAITGEPRNLEEQAISLVGRDIYEKLIQGYTQKQWGRPCSELPAFIIKRLPVRYTYDNNYFNDRFQGIPIGGYNQIIDRLLEGCDVQTGVDFLKDRAKFEALAEKIVYTGAIDEYFGFKFGALEYRGLRFETERLECDNHQGVAVVNYTAAEVSYTRIIEHKHFEFGGGAEGVTYITREYPADWKIGDEAYYPVNNAQNSALYERYAALAKEQKNVIFGGRLAEYKYYDMDKVIESAMARAKAEFKC